MPLEIVTIPCLADNYAFLVHSSATGETALVDAPEARPILDALARHDWHLSEIWLTHHHWDHVDACGDIKDATGAKVVGAEADAHRLPPLNTPLGEGQDYRFAGEGVAILDVPGHTVGHIAFHLPESKAVFTGDSLMALGCGRLFEGNANQMWTSLSKLAALPAETTVYSGHEYTQTNAQFALTIEPDNPDLQKRARQTEAARAAGNPTIPSSLELELATNPFLRADLPGVKSALGMKDSPDVDVFAEIRRRKDSF